MAVRRPYRFPPRFLLILAGVGSLVAFRTALSRAAAPPWPLKFVASPEIRIGPGTSPVGLSPALLGDRGPDLVIADAVKGLIVLDNDGLGSFHEGAILPAGNSATCVGAGYVGAGPVQTLATANMLDTYLTAFVPTAGGSFKREDIPMTASPQSVAVVVPPGQNQAAVLAGLSDVPHSLGQILLLNRTAIRWEVEGRVDLPWLPMGIVPVHLRADGVPELIVSPADARAVAVIAVESPSQLRVEQILQTDHPVVSSSAAVSPAGPVIVSVGLFTATIWLRGGDGMFRRLMELTSPAPLMGVAVQDLNGDGWPEILATTFKSLVAWQGNSDLTFSGPRTLASARQGISPVVADFDRDGRADVAWNNSVGRSVDVLLNRTPSGLPGDGNGDGVVDQRDVALALRAASGLVTLTDSQRERLDVRPVSEDGSWGDGKVTVDDAVQILKWSLGIQ